MSPTSPIQPTNGKTGSDIVEIFAEFADGLKDLEGFSQFYLLHCFHKIIQTNLVVTPFLDKEPGGICASRAPSRPNPIGLSLVELDRLENNLIYVDRLDVLNETPQQDVKPYVPDFAHIKNVRIGWLVRVNREVQN